MKNEPLMRETGTDGGGKPFRVQLSRIKGFKLPPNTIVVARPTKWGNPFMVADVIEGLGSRKAAIDDCVRSFRSYLERMAEGRALAVQARTELRGRNLACWCPLDQPCHADVLLKISNHLP